MPLPKIDAARQAILQLYRSDGYVLSTVSVSHRRKLRLRFEVTEGRIASVKLDGDIGPAGTQVLRFLNRLTEKQPIRFWATLERYLLLAQDVPGVDDPGGAGTIGGSARRAEPDRPGFPQAGVGDSPASTIVPSTRRGRSRYSA